MRAWLIKKISDLTVENRPLEQEECPAPVPGPGEVLIRVSVCGICHTELDEIEGRTPPTKFPVIPGHQVVGRIDECGAGATRFKVGDRVGVAWIFSACGVCEFCRKGLENLCPQFQATGRDKNGGYAELMVVNEAFAYAIPDSFSDAEAAPLLCAGAIGYRSLMLAGLNDGENLGLTGFGASGHLVLKLARHLYPNSPVVVFARSREEQEFARTLGAVWSGEVHQSPPARLDAIIDTTPVWTTIVESLLHLKPGGRLVINAIRKEDGDKAVLASVRYQDHLWMEKEVKTVANIVRADVENFLRLAAEIPLRPEVEEYSFENANTALLDLKHKHVKGAKVLVLNS